MPEDALVDVLHAAADAVRHALDGLGDWGLAGTRAGQYRSDLAADEAAIGVLTGAGLGVLSEESGVHHPSREVTVVLDPVDGSTNASRGLPWFATSLCAVDGSGPLAAVVVNQATGTRFEAVRDEGARCDGRPVSPSGCTTVGRALLGLSSMPARNLGWEQYRALGAAALDLCAVAAGALDGYIGESLAPWDYLGALLVCQEAGAAVADGDGRHLVVLEHGARRAVVAASTPSLLAELLEARRSASGGSGKIS